MAEEKFDKDKLIAEIKEIKDAREALVENAKAIDEKMEKAVEQAKNSSKEQGEKIASELKAELKELVDKQTENSARYDKLFETQQKHLNEMDVKLQNSPVPKEKSFREKLRDKMETDDFKAKIKVRDKFALSIDTDEKAVGDMRTATSFTGPVVELTSPAQFQAIPGVVYDPARPVRIRDLVTVLPTGRDSIPWLQETGGEGGAAMVAEGGAKPQIDKDVLRINRPVKKIASFFRVPDEMLDDNAFMSSYLTTRGVDDHNDVEDTQILTGDGTGNNLNGITTDGAAYVDALALASAQEYDVLAAGVIQVMKIHYSATGVLLSPATVLDLLTLKDSENAYLTNAIYTGRPLNVAGVPIIISTAIGDDTFIVGNFRQGNLLFQRKAVEVGFFEQDADNVTTNQVTIRIESRLANVVARPNAFSISTGFAAAVVAAQT